MPAPSLLSIYMTILFYSTISFVVHWVLATPRHSRQDKARVLHGCTTNNVEYQYE